ncbi:phage portal protein [Dechloromonas sp. TW-R-39-2]|uniref:phage portal protein n=1 Tax=Dechloromonas sp. TW-R-39-2 TaxID=2654218 RepID=UPI00193E8196|nr:phage portal protein [Dechloromonas sp. TW-R-39-2]QRM19566.1 phage portal protein [Dechloromonas sp. TW-R-39-2]
MKNPVDAIIEFFSPVAGLKRRAARGVLGAYEAGRPGRLRKFHRDTGSANNDVQRGAVPVRVQARHLEQNHDIARGALRVLVNNVVGPSGIGIEPQPRRADGTIHAEYAAALRSAYRDWCKKPEVTHRHHWARAQRLVARTWLRDGEAFAQTIIGQIPSLDHGTRVPFSLELMEPDMVPMHHNNGDRIRQGVELNAWGKTVAFWVHKQHPGEWVAGQGIGDLKRVAASNMLHIAAIDRMHQVRGVSEFASVITRLEDIKDYEESERVAAKIAAMLTGFIRKGTPDLYSPDGLEKDSEGNPLPREIAFQPGMIIDNLGMGEEIGLIDSKRPNPNVVTFRQGQLRAVAAGLGGSYSSISRDYDGTYSSQRQELVEQWVHYATLADEFTGLFVQPVWERFVEAARLSGVVPRPADVVPDSADDALFIAQSMPWIDPLKEAKAWNQLTNDGFASEVEVIRKRGANPRDVLEQIDNWRKQAAEKGLKFSSDAANDVSTKDMPAGGQQEQP